MYILIPLAALVVLVIVIAFLIKSRKRDDDDQYGQCDEWNEKVHVVL